VATISRLLEIIGLFCKRALQQRPYSAQETYIIGQVSADVAEIEHLLYTPNMYTMGWLQLVGSLKL